MEETPWGVYLGRTLDERYLHCLVLREPEWFTQLFLENYTEEELSMKVENLTNLREKLLERKLRYEGHMVDALAISADEGRDKLRKAAESRK